MVRAMVDRPIERPQLKQVLEAARWAPNAGNRHLHRFVVVQVPAPDDAVVICIDQARAVDFGMRANLKGLYVDVGTAAQTMR
jgi:nitroreductase